MEDSKVVIGEDEFTCVFLGKEQTPNAEFARHPRVHWIEAQSGVPVQDIITKIPPKTKAFVLTDGIPPPIYDQLTKEARRVHATYINRKNHRAVRQLLYDLFPPHSGNGNGNGKGPKQVAAKGAIQDLLKRHPPDLSKGSADEAHRLQSIAREEGIPTTHASLAQAISLVKRKMRTGDIPESLSKVTPMMAAASTLDDCIAGLTELRDWVLQVDRENAELKQLVQNFRKLLEPPK